jgi:hypothetical protein
VGSPTRAPRAVEVVNYACHGVIVDLTVVSPTTGSSGQRDHIGKEIDEMLGSATGLAGTTDPVHERISQPPSVEVSSTEVLISTQEVVFSTAAALGTRRGSIGGRFVAIMRRMLTTSTDDSGPRRRDYPNRYEFLENALMAREMERL